LIPKIWSKGEIYFIIRLKIEFGDDKSKQADLRYDNYLKRYEMTLKSVSDERKALMNS